jgi:hypothetical protein
MESRNSRVEAMMEPQGERWTAAIMQIGSRNANRIRSQRLAGAIGTKHNQELELG